MRKKEKLVYLFFWGSIAIIMSSCVQEDLYDLYEDIYDLNSPNLKRSKFGQDNYYYIPDNLLHTTGCGYKSIHYVLGNSYSINDIKDAMAHFDNNVEAYPHRYLAPAIMRLTNKIVVTLENNISSSDVSVGDIICVPPMTFGNQHMTSGHCTVVTEIISNEHFTLAKCYDGCEFDVIVIERVIQTSNL